MIKGQYYYMEAVHKELFGNDVLQVAVRMENGQFIGPIGEEYLYFYYKSSKESKSNLLTCCFTHCILNINLEERANAFQEGLLMPHSLSVEPGQERQA